jgi:SAM-dependent methyltransferase
MARGGDVLEVGYGLGMASRAIRELKPELHWIIERYAEVLTLNSSYQESALSGIVIAKWEIALPLLRDSSFDVLLFDPDPPAPESYDGSVAAAFTFIAPALSEATRILRPNGIAGFIDFSAMLVAYQPFQQLIRSLPLVAASIAVPTDAPPNCRYAPHAEAHVVSLTKSAVTDIA